MPGWFFADVDGDGKADAISLDASGSHVFFSDGQRFAAQEGAFERTIPLGERGTQFADVNGDGRADAVVQNHRYIAVYTAAANDFAPARTWSNQAYYGGL